MGREIRKVPADWQHPRYTEEDATNPKLIGKYRPLFDEDYESAAEEWIANFKLWCEGKHPDQDEETKYYWDYSGGPPSQDSYRDRKWTDDEATHFVVYETVSEGTPVTPAFATPAELVEHLATKGTDWDHGKSWDRHSAEQFVQAGWAPSGMMRPGQGFKTVNEAGFYE
jgi:hypothetical protein